MSEDDSKYKILELLARLADFKGLHYEIGEIKDGRVKTIVNVRIDEIDITKPV